MPRDFIMSTSRTTADVTSASAPTLLRLPTASRTATVGSVSSSSRSIADRCASRPKAVARSPHSRSSPASTHRPRSMPTDLRLRTIWSGDSSKETNRADSPRAQAASTAEAASVVLPVPAVPVTRTVEPR